MIAAEVTLRLFRQSAEVRDGEWVERDGYYVYPLLTTFSVRNEEGKSIEIETDEHGLRNPPNTLDRAELILLGDSFVAAVNTPKGETLADRLRDAGVSVYGAGVGGLSTFQELRLLRALLVEARPRTVVLCFYLGNDFHDNYFDHSDQELHSSLFRPPAHTNPPPLCRRSALCSFLYEKVYLGQILGWERDRMGSFSLSELYSFRLTYGAEMELAVSKTNQALAEFAPLSRERGFHALILGIPSKAQVARSLPEVAFFDRDTRSRSTALATIAAGYSFDRPDAVARELAERNGVQYVSLLEVFRNTGAPNLYFQIDSHWNATAQALAAQRLLAVLNPSPSTGDGPVGHAPLKDSPSGGE